MIVFRLLYGALMIYGFLTVCYFYLFIFNSMSEQELIDSLWYWHLPLTFGMFGLMAVRLKKIIPADHKNSKKFLVNTNDGVLIMLLALAFVLGIGIGPFLLFIPFNMFSRTSALYHLKVAVVGTVVYGIIFFFLIDGVFSY